jgi:predicted regulator of Ras-like GTPase activity (Roadblock/LC7/MglB family)
MAATVQETALQQLAAVPGVVGSLVFGSSGTVVSSFFPPVFDAAGLQQLASQLAGDAYFQDWLGDEKAQLDLRFGDGRVVVRSMLGSWLLVVCTPEANSQLLSMSLTQAIRRLRAPRPAPQAPPALPRPSPLDRLRAIASAELGAHAAQALEILAAAGSSPKELERAVADVEKMTRLFISKTRAEEIGRSMREVLGT